MEIILLLIALLMLNFIKYAETHETISKNDWINTLNTKTNRTITRVIAWLIIISIVIKTTIFALVFAAFKL